MTRFLTLLCLAAAQSSDEADELGYIECGGSIGIIAFEGRRIRASRVSAGMRRAVLWTAFRPGRLTSTSTGPDWNSGW